MKSEGLHLVWAWLVAWLVALAPASGHAQVDWSTIPPPLRPWVPWVMESLDETQCPTVLESPVCVWPGRVQLDLTDYGGRFRLNVFVDRAAMVQLPGSREQWPLEVRGVGGGLAVIDVDGAPFVRVAAGAHDIEGVFLWRRLPESLTLPSTMALVGLRVNGAVVAAPKRAPNMLWLANAPRDADAQQRLDVRVYRLLEDGVPMVVTTRLELTAAGKAREVELGQVWLAGGKPLGFSSTLPARIENDGTIVAQVFAGKHSLTLREVHADNITDLRPPQLPNPWPSEEIWSWKPDERIRQVELHGGAPIDPERVGVPESWRGLAAYRVTPEARIEFSVGRRGDPQPTPNRLRLERQLWLDIDGSGFTVLDHLTGKLNHEWRLDLQRGDLGHVSVGGAPRLVTLNPESNAQGVELRRSDVEVDAQWRLTDDARRIPAVGWSQDAEQLQATLHLPPGWKLFDASGVDSLDDTWLSSWDLFALFFVLIVSLATAKLAQPVVGALALLALIVIHDQENAPFALWLMMLVGIALLRVTPSGWLRQLVKLYSLVTATVLLLTLVVFSIEQVRTAVYPQTGLQQVSSPFTSTRAPKEPARPEAAPSLASDSVLSEPTQQDGSAAHKEQRTAEPEAEAQSAPEEKAQELTPDSKAVIQTGHGVPNWEWSNWVLSWSGPVHQNHEVRLYLLSPTANLLLGFLRLLLSLSLAYLLLRLALYHARRPPASPAVQRQTASAVAKLFGGMSLLLGLLAPRAAAADFPDAKLLEQLRARLSSPAPCRPNCLTVQRARLEIERDQLTIRTEVHVEATSSYQLPGPAKDWPATDVRVNGQPAAGLVLAQDGFFHLRLEPGLHQVRISGPVVDANLTLNLGDEPRRVEVQAKEWEVTGLDADGLARDGVLSLHRKLIPSGDADAGAAPSGNVAGWLLVRRQLHFGVNWTVTTQVEPLLSDAPVTARIPLLPGERITSRDVSVENGAAVITLERRGGAQQFESSLSIQPQLQLRAATGQRFNERWDIRCDPSWHCEFEGLPPISRHQDGVWQPVFAPWPGETLTVNLAAPAAAEGPSTTVEQATLNLTPGVRLLKAELVADVVTSTQESLLISLPQGARVQALTVDGIDQSLGNTEGQVSARLAPGRHQLLLSWQQPGGMQVLFRAPPVKLGDAVANARVQIHLPENRWLLLAGGPGWGPAILFWGYLLLILLLAPLLARIPKSPLRTWEWAVLALGLTQVPPFIAAVIVGWFFLFAYAPGWRPKSPFGHNVAQMALVFATGLFLASLFGAVYDGLLSTPDMEVRGTGSNNRLLSWYLDRTDGSLQTPWTVTANLWVWRVVMLAWALWLAYNLLRWLRWGWQMFTSNGLWLARPPQKPTPQPTQPAPAAAAAGDGTWRSMFYPQGFTDEPATAHGTAQARSTPPPAERRIAEEQAADEEIDSAPSTLPGRETAPERASPVPAIETSEPLATASPHLDEWLASEPPDGMDSTRALRELNEPEASDSAATGAEASAESERSPPTASSLEGEGDPLRDDGSASAPAAGPESTGDSDARPSSVALEANDLLLDEDVQSTASAETQALVATGAETPAAHSEDPQARTNVPQAQPEDRQAQPDLPETQPEDSQAQPDLPETQPEDSQAQPDLPETQPEDPQAQPDLPETQPEDPQAQPDLPETQPEDPQAQPEDRQARTEQSDDDR